ncbi:MAG: hypothetical protein IJ190_11325 [Prevotella sp.]|nr:hypothetical protein [Prevotella sp.]
MVTLLLFITACSTEEAQAQSSSNMEIIITVGGKTFTATLEDTETGRAFYNRLPLTLNMSELNGNEKYYYLDEALPTASQYYSTIHAGDLMLYGNSCVVLFYGEAGGYSYTRLGKLNKTEGLVSAVGISSVSVTFSKVTSDLSETVLTKKDKKIYVLNGSMLKGEPSKGIFIKNGNKVVK